MLKCSFCGHENDESHSFCEKCKTDLTVLTAELTPALVAAEGAEQSGSWKAAAVAQEIEVPTLHLDRVPLVENLGPRAGMVGEMTRPYSGPRGSLPLPPTSPAMPVDGAESANGHAAVKPDAETLKPRLVVLRGEKIDMHYPLYHGKNYLGRTDDKPVDIDLENQEPADRIWTSRQHAVITFEEGILTIEDLNSLNGTFVNRTRVHPGQVRTLQANDIIQVGTVQMRLTLN